jgi:hypothetical protein
MKDFSHLSFRISFASSVAIVWPLLSLGAARAASYHELILSDLPVAYYRFEELPGATVAADSSANHFDATYNFNSNSTSPKLGQPGIDTNSISFSGKAGSSGSVTIPFQQELSPVTADGTHGAPFSVECWAQPNAQPAGGLYASVLGMFGRYTASGTYANASGWNIAQTPGPKSVWLFNMKNGPFFTTPAAINLLQWYYLAGVFDGTNLTFYINGLSQGSQKAASYLADNGADGQVGVTDNAGSPPYTVFSGGVDEIAFYTNALTADRILAHYQLGTNSFRAVPAPPSILQSPVASTNFAGTMVTFTVRADGTAPLSYQWLKGTNDIAGATNSSLTFIGVFPDDNGAAFSARVSNAYGATNSAAAALTLLTNFYVVHQPLSITRKRGSHAAFRVAVEGAQPISYQWFKGTNMVAGATNDTLWLTNIAGTDNGAAIRAHVSNPFTAVDSDAATLTVQDRPVRDPIPGYSQTVLQDDPVAYWRLDELNATSPAADIAGSFDGSYDENNGTFTFGLASGVPREADAALGLTGGAVVTIPYALELNPVTGPWSAEAWVKPSTLDPNHFRTVFSSMWNSDFGNHVFGWNVYQHEAGVWTLNIFNGGGASTFLSDFTHNPLVTNAWYHLVIADDLNAIHFYVNGLEVGTAAQSATGFTANGINGDPAVAGGPTVLGQRSDNAFDPFDGVIDEVAFYNYALSLLQVQAHYANSGFLTFTRTGNNTVLSWSVGTLQQSASILGQFANVPGASSPYSIPEGTATTFYRLEIQ